MKKQYFLFVLPLYIIAVFYLALTTPLSPHEAKLLYASHNAASVLMHWSSGIIPGFIGLRIFFVFFGFLSIWFFYELGRRHFEKREDAYLATFIFMLLPGIITASTLSNIGILVLPLVLLFVLLYEERKMLYLPLIMLALFFIHEASILFFVAVLLYGIIHKDKKLTIAASAFLLAFVYLAKGITIGGRPSGHFAEIFGLYATVFSPLVFLYFFYTMYRILLRGKKNLLWYISFTAFAFSLLLSIRQRIYLTDFAPYVLGAVILMLDQYNLSVRVRLPQFQTWYRRGFYVLIGSLVLSALVILFNKVSYDLSSNPQKHFAKRIYQPYYLAEKLKSEGIDCYDTDNERERYQLRYYGIHSCKTEQ
ncbi:Arginine/ornithine antiporter ArcD [hydrothermal vent metagenome]|uniref:Arginine/ornithine antiporter ArcD n=1 Tax=hydrothermal vent metagenome TaxID=652676 RepID=A0A1W1CSM8_9ZZZZ